MLVDPSSPTDDLLLDRRATIVATVTLPLGDTLASMGPLKLTMGSMRAAGCGGGGRVMRRMGAADVCRYQGSLSTLRPQPRGQESNASRGARQRR